MMINVLLIQNSISNYRVPVYNIIAKKCNLTVGYSEGKIPSGIEFQVKYLPVKKYHGIYVHTISLRKIAQEYDVVIGMMTYNWISNYMLAWGRHKYKFIPWVLVCRLRTVLDMMILQKKELFFVETIN